MPEDLARLIAQAKVGIHAVIDEATGFQEHRAPDDLRRQYAELGGSEADYTAPNFPPAETT